MPEHITTPAELADQERQRRIRGRMVRFELTRDRLVVYSTASIPREHR